ncbi:MAG: BT4734/BF3469 family protein [bacterium]
MIANRAGSAERFWDREFSLFRNIKANSPAGTVSLGAFVNQIQRGTWKNKILLLRGEQISNPGKAKRIKSSLPAAKVHGVFKGNRAVDLETCSGLICLDFDKVGGEEAIHSLKTSVSKHPSVLCAFTSPSGNGLKVVFASDSESEAEHNQCWTAAREVFAGYIAPSSSTKLDSTPKNIAANCFVSYDPDIYINRSAVPFLALDGNNSSIGAREGTDWHSSLLQREESGLETASLETLQSCKGASLGPTTRTQQTTTSEISVVSEVSISQSGENHWKTAEIAEKAIEDLPPALRKIYERFISRRAVYRGQRFFFLQKLIKPLFRTCGREQALKLIELHYGIQTGIWSTPLAEHLKDAQAALEAAEEGYPEEISAQAAVIYKDLPTEREKAAFRICLDLSQSRKGEFHMSMNQLGERIGVRAEQAKRILTGLRAVGAIELCKAGKKWAEGDKPRAHSYLWTADLTSQDLELDHANSEINSLGNSGFGDQ